MVSWFQLTTIVFMQIIQCQQLSIGVNESCQDALYNKEVVTSCPKSKEEWDIAASRKNCSEIAAVAKANNCTIDEKQPKYHCVMNALRTYFLEVCADEKKIRGHCTEFNEFGRIIQIHDSAKCKDVFPNCDDEYSSLDAYKYQGCNNLVNQPKVTTNSDYPTSGYDRIWTFIATIIIALLVGLVVGIALYLKGKRERGIQKQEKDLEEQKNLMDNALENKNKKGGDLKPLRQYLYYNAKRFPHFFYVYNQICDYKQQLDKENVMPKNIIIQIELVGAFTDDNRQLLPKGTFNKRKKKDEIIWEAIPLLCFQNDVSLNSALEARPRESVCHPIFIKSGLDATDKEDDSIIIVDQNKDEILKAITSCLEQPLCHILQELSDLHSDCTEKMNQIMALKKMMLDHTEDTMTPTVPDNIKKYLTGRSDVVGYTMMRNSSLEVEVKKETDAMQLENDLMKIDSEFFKTCRLNILNRRMIKRYTCADATNLNDDKKNKSVLTSSNEFTNDNQTAQREDEYVSIKRDLLVLESPKTQEVIYQRGGKSVAVCFAETGGDIEVKLRF